MVHQVVIYRKRHSAEITKYTERLGKKLLILVSKSGKKRVEEKINKAVEGQILRLYGKYSMGNVQRAKHRIGKIKERKCDIVVGIGGEKYLILQRLLHIMRI